MKRLQPVILFILLISSNLFSQTAPDFTVTDSWGNSHSLYADYLSQGKTVVLKIFYVACPPCNTIAPHLEPLYQEWGGGQADVQFIELSIRQNDSNSSVNGYKTNHGTTFPAAGGEGNSVAATVPYTNGTFGLWTGTPTFVVVAPDGTVNYDVYGVGINGTIAALDAAIEATGADGSITSVEATTQETFFTIESNIVSDELKIHSLDYAGTIDLAIVSPSGKHFTTSKENVVKGTALRINTNSLPAGIWVCSLADKKSGLIESYLFVKI